MGRGGGKLNMKLIADERSRRVTFQKRKRGIMKKAYEFSTLCGVDMCLIIYGPKQSDRRPAEFHTWPENRDEVNRIICKFKLNKKPATKTYNLSDWLHEQKVKMDAKVSKLRSDMYETKYPTWDDRIKNFSEHQLEELVKLLDEKIESGRRMLRNVRAPMELKLSSSNHHHHHHHHQYASYLGGGEYVNEEQKCSSYLSMMDNMHIPFSSSSTDHHHQSSTTSSYSQMLQYDPSDLKNSDPLMGYPTYYDPNQMMNMNLMMFNNNGASMRQHYAQLMPKQHAAMLAYTQYPMNILSISSQLGTSSQVNNDLQGDVDNLTQNKML